ncbi:hypothetical protein [Hymenobacter properus]|uniref:Uncharacterized protein n=1 Tax=Hymenobacter properus TaxID=2791026 RepID=A0A931FLD8_9BACT|nr:hypothetical protein [Hymenobacter properus]MBF9141931.1 hypothetical protein [Hymenobacter properus]MBR7720739.1 hypothetical protein [Microvirga sp. SRT04]
MKARPFFPSLAVAALLVLSAGCSKKSDPYAPPKVAPSAGSYDLNGRIASSGAATSRQITAQVRTVTTSDNLNDQLEVRFTTTPKPAIGEEHLLLTFIKGKDQPATAYRYFNGAYYTDLAPYALFTDDVATIMPTSDGAFSGMFSAKCSWQVGTPSQTDYTIYGTFTNAKP